MLTIQHYITYCYHNVILKHIFLNLVMYSYSNKNGGDIYTSDYSYILYERRGNLFKCIVNLYTEYTVNNTVN